MTCTHRLPVPLTHVVALCIVTSQAGAGVGVGAAGFAVSAAVCEGISVCMGMSMQAHSRSMRLNSRIAVKRRFIGLYLLFAVIGYIR